MIEDSNCIMASFAFGQH